MRRLWRWVLGLIFIPLTPNPSADTTRGEGRKGAERPLWVDAGLVGMRQEIGLVWQHFPTVMEIYMVLPGVEMEDAEWIWNACQVNDSTWAIVAINDVARALIWGVPITEIRRRGLMVMQMSPEWERGE